MKIIDRLLFAITNLLPCRIINDGKDPYLERFYVGTLFGWRFYLHRFVDSDPNRGLHCHPWHRAFSIILSGWYWEETRMGFRKVRWFNSLTGDSFHRVVLPFEQVQYTYMEQGHRRTGLRKGSTPKPCWTLFFHTAANVKAWGFLKPIADSERRSAGHWHKQYIAMQTENENLRKAGAA